MIKPPHLRAVYVILTAISLGVVLQLASGGISLLEPTPFWLIYLYQTSMLLGINVYLFGSILLVTTFLAWTPQLFKGVGLIPKRSIILFIALSILTFSYIASRYRFMSESEMIGYFTTILSINVIFFCFLTYLLLKRKDKPSFTRSLFFHWLLFAWPATYGFAWMHEAL